MMGNFREEYLAHIASANIPGQICVVSSHFIESMILGMYPWDPLIFCQGKQSVYSICVRTPKRIFLVPDNLFLVRRTLTKTFSSWTRREYKVATPQTHEFM